MSVKKKPVGKSAGKSKGSAQASGGKTPRPVAGASKPAAKRREEAGKRPTAGATRPVAKPPARNASKPPASKPAALKVPAPQPAKNTVTAKKTPAPKTPASLEETEKTVPAATSADKPKIKTTVDEMALDVEEKEQLLEEEKKDLVRVLREDDDEPLETSFVPTDTSERYILVVDEEGQRRTETLTIVQQILPNAVVEVADDPEEALEIMQDVEFDTYVVNFLMPGYSASPFVKAVANHPDHPLLIGFAADKISDALDQKKGLKIIPLKRLFDLEVSGDGKDKGDKDE